MCVVSNVHDHFDPLIPREPWTPYPWSPSAPGVGGGAWPYTTQPDTTQPYTKPPWDPKDMEELIKNFRKAVGAAKIVDELTNQPDCVDPKKAELENHIKRLEDEIALLKRIQALEAEAAILRKQVGK